MKEHSVLDSYIVRIYRVNTANRRIINGLVERLDGSGEQKPFADIDELGTLLNGRNGSPQKRTRKSEKNTNG